MSRIKSSSNYMFHKNKGPSNIYWNGAYFSTGDLLEGIGGSSHLSALLIVGSCPVSYICGVIALLCSSFPESLKQTHPALRKQANPLVCYAKSLSRFSKVSLSRMMPVTEKGRIFYQALFFTIET